MKRTLLLVTLLVVVGAFAGFQQYSSWSLNRSQNNPELKSAGGAAQTSPNQSRAANQSQGGARSRDAVPVLVATAVRKAVPVQLHAVGNVEPYTTVSIKSQVTGVLLEAHFKEGQDVKKGQQLFTIDPRPFEAALRQAEANMQRDNAQLKNLREQVRR